MKYFFSDIKDWSLLTPQEKRKYWIVLGVIILFLTTLLLINRTKNKDTSEGITGNDLVTQQEVQSENSNVSNGGTNVNTRSLLNQEQTVTYTEEQKRDAFLALMNAQSSGGVKDIEEALDRLEEMDLFGSLGIGEGQMSPEAKYFYSPGMSYQEYYAELREFYYKNEDLIQSLYKEYVQQHYREKQKKFQEALKADPSSNVYH